jgi:hypothetical protein
MATGGMQANAKAVFFTLEDKVLVQITPPKRDVSVKLCVLLVDVSASMQGQMKNLKESLNGFLEKLDVGCALRLISFSDDAKLAFTSDSFSEEDRARAIEIVNDLKVCNTTNFEAAFSACNAEIDEACNKLELARSESNVLMLSDGAPTSGFGAHDWRVFVFTKLLEQLNYGRFFLLNFNTGASVSFSEAVLAKNQQVFYAEDAELRSTFSDALSAIAGVPAKLALVCEDGTRLAYDVPAANTSSGVGFAIFLGLKEKTFTITMECMGVETTATEGKISVDVENLSVLKALFQMQDMYQRLRDIDNTYRECIEGDDVVRANTDAFNDDNDNFIQKINTSSLDTLMNGIVDDFVVVNVDGEEEDSPNIQAAYRSLSASARKLSQHSVEVKKLCSEPEFSAKRVCYRSLSPRVQGVDDEDDEDDVGRYRSLSAPARGGDDDGNFPRAVPSFKGSLRACSHAPM